MDIRTKAGVVAIFGVLAVLSGCGGSNQDPPSNSTPLPGDQPGQTPTTPEPLPSTAPQVSPSPVPTPTQGLWVTFDVSGEKFRAVLTRSEAIADVLVWASGAAFTKTPYGTLADGGEFNSPWKWHLVPETVQFADDLIGFPECMSRPSILEQEFLDQCQTYLPPAKIESAQDCRSGTCAPLPVSNS